MSPDPDLHPVAALLAPVSDKPPGRSGWRDLGRNLMASAATAAGMSPITIVAVEVLLQVASGELPGWGQRTGVYALAIFGNFAGAVAKQWLSMMIHGNPDLPPLPPYEPAARKAA